MSLLFWIIFLKGQCHEIFCFLFFSCISFPPAPEYHIMTVLNFFENSRRYSQAKVHHRYQRHRRQICHRCQRHRRQIATGVNDTGGKLPPVSTTPAANLPPVSTTPVAILLPFSLVLLIPVANLPPVSTIPAANLPPVSMTPVAICHRYQRRRR